jgi:hypothetical protein
MSPTAIGKYCVALALVASAVAYAADGDVPAPAESSYEDLVNLFREWRQFEQPPLRDGAPDYTRETTAARHRELASYQSRLRGIDPSAWPVPQQVDWHLVRAEMNGMDFNLRVLQPWARDPAYYASVRSSQSDTPAEEGPTIHNAVRLWKYSIWPRTSDAVPSPLTAEAEKALAAELRTVPPLLEQARINLVGDTRDLWTAAVHSFEGQRRVLEELAAKTADTGSELRAAVADAREATDTFLDWLRREAPLRTGASGIGTEDYSWFLQNVLYLPLTWQDELTIVRRELSRSHASLRLEEHRNRHLPQLEPAPNPEAYARMQDEAIHRYMRFLTENDVMPVEEWWEGALRERMPRFAPAETRNFFAQAQHREPNTLWAHMYHWWDLAQFEKQPHASPIRREPLLYNVWMTRSEGMATVNEEWMMHAGLFDDNPRAREIIWVMLAMRAARALGSLHAHSNEMTMAEASDVHVKWTPRGWMRRDGDLLTREQQMYLRQPGYGPSYVTGARLMDDLVADRARQLGDEFSLKRFFSELNAIGMIPISLIRWEMTGDDSDVRAVMGRDRVAGEPSGARERRARR